MSKLSQGLAAGLLALSFGTAAVNDNADARGRSTGPAAETTQAYVQPSQVRGDQWIPDPENNEEHARQHDMLEPHRDFINSMGGCCNTRDGRGNLHEEINTGEDAATHPYIVTITHDLNGKLLDEPTILKIPKEKVISVAQAKAYCKPKLMADKDSTCRPPAFNVLWAYDNSDWQSYQVGLDKHKITTLYCYYPKPSLE